MRRFRLYATADGFVLDITITALSATRAIVKAKRICSKAFPNPDNIAFKLTEAY